MAEFAQLVINKAGWGLLWMPAAHFVSSGFVGLLVYVLTLTTLSHGGFGIFLKERSSSAQGFSIYQYSFVVAFLLSLYLHLLEDYTLNIF